MSESHDNLDLTRELARAELKLANIRAQNVSLGIYSAESIEQLKDLEKASAGGDPVLVERCEIRKQMVENNVGVSEMHAITLAKAEAEVRRLRALARQ
jgi:hypothetical protein